MRHITAEELDNLVKYHRDRQNEERAKAYEYEEEELQRKMNTD